MRQTVGFLSRVESQYNEHICVGSSVLTSQSLPQYQIAAHSEQMLRESGDSKLRSNLLYSKHTVSICWHLPVLSPLWKDFHLQRKSCCSPVQKRSFNISGFAWNKHVKDYLGLSLHSQLFLTWGSWISG